MTAYQPPGPQVAAGDRKAFVVTGPTASGKTAFAIELAQKHQGEIVSADSMQIYRGMDIGTAKPAPEELALVPHHLIDVADPEKGFTVVDYREMAGAVIEDIFSRGKIPVVAGGTGLYINSLLYDMDFSGAGGGRDEGLRQALEQLANAHGNGFVHNLLRKADPAAALEIHPNNRKRVIRALERVRASKDKTGIIPFSQSFRPGSLFAPEIFLLTCDRETLYRRIDARVDRMMDAGLLREVEGLKNRGLSAETTAMMGIGYKELLEHLRGQITLPEAIDRIKRNTRRYAKRQMTWFRKYEGAVPIQWAETEAER